MEATATAPASTRDRRRQRTRRELAEAAVRLFEEKGFAATTVGEIADAADYSESTFFRHFARKEDPVFFDLPERLEALRADFAAPNHGPAWTTVRNAFVSNARVWEAIDGEFALARVRLFHDEPALSARYLEYCLEWEDAVAEIVAAELGNDPDGEATSRLVAGATVAAFRAAFRAVLLGGRSLSGELAAAFDRLERGLGAAS